MRKSKEYAKNIVILKFFQLIFLFFTTHSKRFVNKFEIKINDAMKLAEDNAQADLEAQDYDMFGQNKI